MTVSELIEELKKYDGGMKVVVEGYKADYDDPKVWEGNVVVDGNWDGTGKVTSCFGRHEEWWVGVGVPTAVVVVGR